ncbi:MAG TPA: DegT/DnrJ/EryC1/StrS family aminotransferase [Burkholderiales bacterium]
MSSRPIPARAERLAIEGGKPARAAPLAPWPFYAPDEIEAVSKVLASGRVNYWTGDEARAFEREYAEHTGCHHAVALANGTVALELALYTLGIGTGDEVIVPSRTFIACASCAVMRGSTPVCAEVDRENQNLTAETIRAVLTPKTRAIIAVHLAGWPCDMDPIMALARERNLKVIEDCAQAHGATYKGRPVGSIGDIGAFSFCQDKIITTGGEGGMLVTNDEAVWAKAWSYKDHGKSYDAIYNRPVPGPGLFNWIHESFGTNWRMTEMQAAIGRIQLRKLGGWCGARRRNADVLTQELSHVPALRLTVPRDGIGHAYYKYYAFVRSGALKAGWNRDRIVEAVSAEGVPCAVGSCSEIYLEKAFPESMRPAERFKAARELGETSLMFMVHPTLSERDMRDVARAVEKVMRRAAL